MTPRGTKARESAGFIGAFRLGVDQHCSVRPAHQETGKRHLARKRLRFPFPNETRVLFGYHPPRAGCLLVNSQ